MSLSTVADPEFPRRGGDPKMGVKPITFLNFSQKLHENERNWTQRGGMCHWRPLLDLSLSVCLSVCGQPTSELHYGATTCEACRVSLSVCPSVSLSVDNCPKD